MNIIAMFGVVRIGLNCVDMYLFICRNDIETSFNLEIRIISPTMRGPWFGINKVVDSDTTNVKDLVDEILNEFPCRYGDVVKLFYFCVDSKSNI